MILNFIKALFFKRDKVKYFIPLSAINITEKILKEYSSRQIPNEGLVYWSGIKEKDKYFVKMVVAPKTKSYPARIEANQLSNVSYVQQLYEQQFIHVGQVHTHPGANSTHTQGDNQWAAFKVKNLLSIVVPFYSKYGMLPLTKSGIHIFNGTTFEKLSQKLVANKCKIQRRRTVIFKDFRDE